MAAGDGKRGTLWEWVQDVGKTCGFAQQAQPRPMWVRANPELFPQEVPGMTEELLAQASQSGGSLEEKIQTVAAAFKSSARQLESLQYVLRRRTIERKQRKDSFPAEVEEVIAEGSYLDSFLDAYDGQSFLLHCEEIVPCHAYRLALEVHSGGAYWSSIPVQNTGTVRHKVEMVSASSPAEGSSSVVSQFGAAQRGAVFVWRWQYLTDQGPYSIPEWLSRPLGTEGNDPLRKLLGELEVVRRWEQHVRQDTAKHVKQGTEVKDPYIREVLRLWPTEPDPHGGEQLKKCAWVEGLDARLFVGRTVLICRIPYDEAHSLSLTAVIAKRHADENSQQDSSGPSYRLTTSWQWPGGVVPSCADESRPGTSKSLVGTALSLANSEMTRPGTEMTRPGTACSTSSVMTTQQQPEGTSSPSKAMQTGITR